MKEFGSTLEVRGLKERTQSLSNVDILISPCDPDHRPTHTCPADTADANVEKPAEKIRLEAAASFPLERSKVTQYSSSPTLSSSPSSNRKSISSIVYSPVDQDQDGVISLTPQGEQGGEMVDSNHGNGGGGAASEELLVGEDRMYPTLRSKSLNINPRKTRTKRRESEETPRSTSSVRDLVSVFSSGATVQDQVQRL